MSTGELRFEIGYLRRLSLVRHDNECPATRHERQREHLSHREPIRPQKIAQLGVGKAHELDAEAEAAIEEQEGA